MTRISFSLVLLLGACGRRPMIPMLDNLCGESTSTPLSQSTWNGTEEADVLAELEASMPDHITWDEATLDAPSAELVLGMTRTSEEPTVVERSNDSGPTWCRSKELMLPLVFHFDIDDGAAVGDVPGTIGVGLEDPTPFVNLDGPVALDPIWDGLADAESANWHTAGPFEWRLFMGDTAFDEPSPIREPRAGPGRISISGDGPTENAVLWRGHWSQVSAP